MNAIEKTIHQTQNEEDESNYTQPYVPQLCEKKKNITYSWLGQTPTKKINISIRKLIV